MASAEINIIPVTVVIPIKNQASALKICLEPLRNMAAVVVVDSGSSDSTVEIAKSWGAEVLQFHWTGGFPKKRNWVLQTHSFSTDWVLFLDADEIVTPGFTDELRRVTASSQYVGYWIQFANYFQGRLLRFGVQQRKLALLRVGAGYYERIEDPGWSDLDMEIHEHPVLNGAVGILRNRIRHEDHSSLSKFIERHNKYSTWEAHRHMARIASPTRVEDKRTFRQKVKYALIESPWLSILYFFYTYFMLGGILDGAAGLHYAIHKAKYFFDISQKIAEIKLKVINQPHAVAVENSNCRNL
jgi:glycosyltransferase involved in cell wall biosynthesis